jgi:LemA protein
MIYLLVLLVVLLLVALILYNSLIRKKNDVENAFTSIDVILKRRYDLIPALVDAVKGYMNYEKALLTEITELRARAI